MSEDSLRSAFEIEMRNIAKENTHFGPYLATENEAADSMAVHGVRCEPFSGFKIPITGKIRENGIPIGYDIVLA